MKKTLRNYQEKLLEDLRDVELAYHYLNEALVDQDPKIFLLALRNVHEAQGGQMTDLSSETNISRENLYRTLSEKGNPKLSNIISLLNAIGFSLAVKPK